MEEVFVACSSSSIAAATFLHPQDANIKTGFLHDADGVPSHLLVALVKRRCTSSEVDVFGRLSHLDIETLCPVAPLVGGQTVGVRVRFEVLNGGHQRHDCFFDALVKLHALHHQVAASVGEFRHVVDVDRAGFNACVAGGARPNGVLSKPCDDVLFGRFARQQRGSVVVGIVTHVVDDLHGIEGLAAGIGRADVLAAGARGACPAVDQVAPRKVGVVDRSKGLNVQLVQQHGFPVSPSRQGLHGRHGPQVVEEDVREGHHQVHVF